jgi:hypothetical protein
VTWFAIFCWDGLLPIAVIAITAVSCSLYGCNHKNSLLTATMLPVIAALIRAATAPRHLEQLGSPRIVRQLIFAAAVAMLFAVELLSSIAQLGNGMPAEIWIMVSMLYFIYFGMIVLAFRKYPLSLLAT